jgi:hypothetical protein
LREYTRDDADRATTDFYGVAETTPHAPVPPQKCPALSPDTWPIIAERAKHESLRDLAAEYGVSHETIRAITLRTQRAAVRAASPGKYRDSSGAGPCPAGGALGRSR